MKEEYQLPDLLYNLAKECVEMLFEFSGHQGNKVTDKTEVSWSLFKNINHVCRKKIESEGEYIEHFLNNTSKKNSQL
jgi:hypothetical protein